MLKYVCFFISLLLVPLYSIAQYTDNINNLDQKKFFGNIDISMSYNFNTISPYSDPKDDTINSLGMNFIYDYFDFSGYIDIHDIFFLFDDRKFVFGKINNYLYGEINPRVSLVSLAKKQIDKSIIFKDFLIAYNFTFDSNDLLQHYLGIGIDFNIPIFSYLKINLYARYNQAYYGRNENSFDGFMLNIAYEIPVYKFKNDIEIIYSSWLKYIFATSPNGMLENEANYSIQWKNTFKLGYKFIYFGYSYEHRQKMFEINTKEANSGEHSIGIYYTYSF